MIKRLISACLVVIFCLSSSLIALAEEIPSEQSNNKSEYLTETERKELKRENNIDSCVSANMKDHACQQTLFENVEETTIQSFSRNTVENTDPNYAYLVENDYLMQGTLEAVNEMRWYAFQANEKSKVTIQLEMAESVDADIYLYQLNGSTLNLIGGSAKEGVGETEYTIQIVEPGIYYFAIMAYSGIGEYYFGFYQSSIDVKNEPNENIDTAVPIDFGTEVKGVIDCINDRDFYKLTLNQRTVVSLSFVDNGYDYLYYSDSSQGSYVFADTNYLDLPAGNHYFAIVSKNKKYSSTDTYTLKINKIGYVANDSAANCFAISEDAKIVFQATKDASRYYVNGHSINIDYIYQENLSNVMGGQDYYIRLEDRSDVVPALNGLGPDKIDMPHVGHYISSGRPAMKVSSRPVLLLPFISNEARNFYTIDCACSGAYAENNFSKSMNTVAVAIDPETGKLIDIVEFNYFYQFAVGGNSITIVYPYTLHFFYT